MENDFWQIVVFKLNQSKSLNLSNCSISKNRNL